MYFVAYDDGNFWSGTAQINTSWRQKGPYIWTYDVGCGWGVPAANKDGRDGINARIASLYWQEAERPKEVLPKLIYNAAETTQYTEILADIRNYGAAITAAFISGNQDIDAYWNTYLAELNRIGLPRFLTIVQGAYDRR